MNNVYAMYAQHNYSVSFQYHCDIILISQSEQISRCDIISGILTRAILINYMYNRYKVCWQLVLLPDSSYIQDENCVTTIIQLHFAYFCNRYNAVKLCILQRLSCGYWFYIGGAWFTLKSNSCIRHNGISVPLIRQLQKIKI